MFFPNPKLITNVISWILILGVFFGGLYLITMNVWSLQFSPDNVVKRFVTIVENPTQTVTDEEKKQLQEITQTNFFSGWSVENNVRMLRKIKQNNPIQVGTINYVGENQKYAVIEFTFQNDFKNPKSKKAKLYLEQYGQWYINGSRWRIYQIDMPEEDNILNTAQTNSDDTQKKIQDQTNEALKKLQGVFNPDKPNN